MDYSMQLQELQTRIDNTNDFLERMELSGEYEELEIKAGLKLPPKPIEIEIGCGDSCSA